MTQLICNEKRALVPMTKVFEIFTSITYSCNCRKVAVVSRVTVRTHDTASCARTLDVSQQNAIGEEGNGKPHHKFHFPKKNSEPCLWFLLRSKSSMLWNSMKILLLWKATETHLMNSISLARIQSPVSGFCYARNRVCNAVYGKSLRKHNFCTLKIFSSDKEQITACEKYSKQYRCI